MLHRSVITAVISQGKARTSPGSMRRQSLMTITIRIEKKLIYSPQSFIRLNT